MQRALVEEFAQATRGSDESVDLFKAAMVVAHIGRPQIDVRGYARLLDMMAADIRHRLEGAEGLAQLVNGIDHELFYVQGFRGNTSNYNDHENSYLDRVLERRTGIPITLSLVYLEVARRLKLRCDGIGYPGHFLVRCGEPEEAIYVDPFQQGSRLDSEELLAGLRGRELGGVSPETFLAAVTRRQILQRMLNNLRKSFSETKDHERWMSAVELALCLEPWNTNLIGERGMLRYLVGEYDAALQDLEQYAAVQVEDRAHPSAMRMLNDLRFRYGREGSQG